MSLKHSLLGSLVALLGCSGAEESTTSAPEAFRGPLEIIVPPDEHGNFPPDLWVNCQESASGGAFQISDLEEIVPLENADPGGVTEAIEPALNHDEAWPAAQDDWLILRETEEEILLVHDDADEPEPRAGGLSFIRVRRVDGEWVSDEGVSWAGPYGPTGSSCPLFYVTPDGLNPVDWWLDPDAPPPDASAVTLEVIAVEHACTSRQEIGDRLLGPQVIMTENAVRMAFAAELPPGKDQDCPGGNPTTPVTVELPEPLGDREIIEGLALGIALDDYLP